MDIRKIEAMLAQVFVEEKMYCAGHLVMETPAMEPSRRDAFLRTSHNGRTAAATVVSEELHVMLERCRQGCRDTGHMLRGLQAVMKCWEAAVAGLPADAAYEAAVIMLRAPAAERCGDCAVAITKGGVSAKCRDCADEIDPGEGGEL